jgi:hypothetical protein
MRIKKPPRADTSRSAPFEGKIAAVAMRALHWCLDGRSMNQEGVWSKGESF